MKVIVLKTLMLLTISSGLFCAQLRAESLDRRQLVNFMSTHGTELIIKQPHSVEALTPGSQAFTNAEGTLKDFPLEMQGRKYIRTSVKGLTLTCAKPGYIAVVCPAQGIACEQVKRAGYARLDYPDFFALNEDQDTQLLCRSFIKKLSKGESLTLNSWAIVVLSHDNVSGVPTSQLRSLDPPVTLPDGSEFLTWEPEVHRFTRTYYVSQRHRDASDENAGTRLKPFKTIGRAAELLQPGERVIVGAGVYRETVRPKRGGDSPDRMISYEAAEGADVIIRGSEVFEGNWEPYKPGVWRVPEQLAWNLTPQMPENDPAVLEKVEKAKKHVYRIKMPSQWFSSGYNPFLAVNQAHRHNHNAQLVRGLIFQDGQRLIQTSAYAELFRGDPGSYWVDYDGLTVHIRPHGDIDPSKAVFEITTRAQWFAPEKRELPYIRVKGFVMEYAANNFPVPQTGGLSVTYGHHWIIEHNTVRWANGVGMDIGKKHWFTNALDKNGYHIIRHNRLTDNGICALAGYGEYMRSTLIESNTFERNCWWTDQQWFVESAAIKLHLTRDVLIKDNLIRDTLGGNAIWLDFDIINSRVTGNLILNTHTVLNGTVFMEATLYPNWVDHNILVNVTGQAGYGLYESTSERQIFAHNFVGNSVLQAVQLVGGKRAHVRVRGTEGRGEHTIRGNLLSGPHKPQIAVTGANNVVEGNVEDGIEFELDEESLELTITVAGDLPSIDAISGMPRDYLGKARSQQGKAVAGPFQMLEAGKTQTFDIDPRSR